MALGKDQLAKLQAWFKEKGVNETCPSCGADVWTVTDLVSTIHYSAGSLKIGTETVPLVQLVCNNCMYVRHYAAVPLGLV